MNTNTSPSQAPTQNAGDSRSSMSRVVSLLRLFRKGGWYRTGPQVFRRERNGTEMLAYSDTQGMWIYMPHVATTSYDCEEYAKLRTALNSINMARPFLG